MNKSSIFHGKFFKTTITVWMDNFIKFRLIFRLNFIIISTFHDIGHRQQINILK